MYEKTYLMYFAKLILSMYGQTGLVFVDRLV